MKGSFTERIKGALRRGWRSWCENSEKYLAVKYEVQELNKNYTGLIPGHYFVPDGEEDKNV